MSRTFRKNEQGRRPEDTRRNKRREKANSHYAESKSKDGPFRDPTGRDMKRFYEDDLDSD